MATKWSWAELLWLLHCPRCLGGFSHLSTHCNAQIENLSNNLCRQEFLSNPRVWHVWKSCWTLETPPKFPQCIPNPLQGRAGEKQVLSVCRSQLYTVVNCFLVTSSHLLACLVSSGREKGRNQLLLKMYNQHLKNKKWTICLKHWDVDRKRSLMCK